jgi:hypothetical protein
MISDADHDSLKDALLDLSMRLTALDEIIKEDNEDARTSLTEAWRAYNRLARIIDPLMVWAVDDDDELRGTETP